APYSASIMKQYCVRRELTRRSLLAGGAGVLLTIRQAHAENFPNGPVKIVTSVSPGAAPDIISRMIADLLTQLCGQQAQSAWRRWRRRYQGSCSCNSGRPYALYGARFEFYCTARASKELSGRLGARLRADRLCRRTAAWDRRHARARCEHAARTDRAS